MYCIILWCVPDAGSTIGADKDEGKPFTAEFQGLIFKLPSAAKRILNLRMGNIGDIIRFLFFGDLFSIATKQFGHRNGDYILTIISSMDMPTYMMMLLAVFGMDVYTFIKYRKVKAPWKVLLYGNPVIFIAIAVNRVIKEYAPYTHLHNVSVAVTLTIGGIWFVIICITGFINKKRQ